MNEHAARDIALVRAIETADTDEVLLTSDDRRYAGRAAAELTHWGASQQRSPATAESFLARRAVLLLDKLGTREPAVRALRATRWQPWIGIALPIAAGLLGAVVEQMADRQHINVLAFPLMAIIAWNLVVYSLLLLRPLLRAGPGPLRRRLLPRTIRGELREPAQPEGAMAIAARRFAGEWSEAVTPLYAARIGRVLHLSAALFALGAIVGLYLRAVVFEYRIGWESTYLQAPTVHAILAFVLGPAASLIGMPFPSIESVAAMRLSGGVGGVDAGPWIHLYALTVGLAVILPRLLLTVWARWRERRLEEAFNLQLNSAYFRRALSAFQPGRARVQIAPYSYTLAEPDIAGLQQLARQLFGESAQVTLRPSVAFGSEADAASGLARSDADVPLTLAVFNAAATPENENHGLFVDNLRAALDTPVALVVDTSHYRRRLGSQAGAQARLQERCEAWQAFGAQRALAVACVDLATPDLRAAERDLTATLGQTA
jgi:hypothetical protein